MTGPGPVVVTGAIVATTLLPLSVRPPVQSLPPGPPRALSVPGPANVTEAFSARNRAPPPPSMEVLPVKLMLVYAM